eukprot:741279-Pleurochrysis_carterae.AAC.1
MERRNASRIFGGPGTGEWRWDRTIFDASSGSTAEVAKKVARLKRLRGEQLERRFRRVRAPVC